MGEVRKYRDTGPLQGKLLKLCPPDHEGIVSIAVLAAHLGVSTWAIYKWIHMGKVPPQRVPELVAMQERAFGRVRVSAADLNPLFAA